MNKKKYCGVVVPMVTPVTPEGKIDTAAVGRIIDSFVKNNVSPLLMGTTGEGNSVSQAEARLLVETAVKAADGKVTVYAGLTGNCISEQRAQVDAFTALGADVIVATLPSYYALTPEQMENYYRQLADYSKAPVMLYNIYATTHMSIPVDVIKRLADHPNIVGHRSIHSLWVEMASYHPQATSHLVCSANSTNLLHQATLPLPSSCK